MTTWITADTHFDHQNIIALCNRPFASVTEMNIHMIQRWTRLIRADDDVIHLGDFAFGDGASIFHQLPGNKHLVIGNHDNNCAKGLTWQSVTKYKEFKTGENNQRVVLFHYPIEDWNGMTRGAVMLHGHSHGRSRKVTGRLDVGVDCHNFEPIKLSDAISMAQRVVAA